MEKKETEVLELAPGEVQDADPLEKALVKINVTRAVLDKLRKEATEFPVIQTKEDYEKIRRHRLDMVPLRTTTEKVMKSMREEANAFAARVIAKEKEIKGDIAASEAIDQAKEDVWLAKLQKEADELAAKEKARVDALLAQLAAYEWQGNPFEVAQDSPVQFAERLSKAQESFRLIEAGRKAEAELKAKEEQEARELAEANRKEAERLAQVKAEQEAAAAKLQKDREDFERQQREAREFEEARQRKVKEDADRAERDRLAKVAEDERKQREAAEAEAKRLQALADAKAKEEADAKAAEAERFRLAALAPDIDKVWAWARSVWDVAQRVPTLGDKTLEDRVDVAAKAIDEILTHLRLSSKS